VNLRVRTTPSLTAPVLSAECRGCAAIVRQGGSSMLEKLRDYLSARVWLGAHPGSIGTDYPQTPDEDAWARAGAAHGVLDAAMGRGALGEDRQLTTPDNMTPAESATAACFYVGFYAIARGLMGVSA
jgi:hypothetical protein